MQLRLHWILMELLQTEISRLSWKIQTLLKFHLDLLMEHLSLQTK